MSGTFTKKETLVVRRAFPPLSVSNIVDVILADTCYERINLFMIYFFTKTFRLNHAKYEIC